MTDSPRRVVGVMTGTSIDGIDAALVEITGRGLAITAALKSFVSSPLGDLAPRLRAVAEQRPTTAGDLARLLHDFAFRHVEILRALLATESTDSEPAPPGLALIAVHGQTVFHAPPYSWQLMNPALIAAAFECPVIHDLRAADLARGGQGAPLTPLADWVLFRGECTRLVVNLGGFCNVTVVPSTPTDGSRLDDHAAAVRGADLCVCNQLLDRLSTTRLGLPYDKDGAVALGGRPDPGLVDSMFQILEGQRCEGRSLGTGDELFETIQSQLSSQTSADALATAAEAIGRVIGNYAHMQGTAEIVLAGGGAKNGAIRAAVERYAKRSHRDCCRVITTMELGVPVDAREAVAWAVLGAISVDGIPIALPSVTGARSTAVAGSVTGQQKNSGAWREIRP